MKNTEPKIHFNPETGEVGECSAKLCPFLDVIGKHYPTEVAAREAFAEYMKTEGYKNTLPMSRRGTQVNEVRLVDLLDVELLSRHINSGHVSLRAHDKDPDLKIFCYTPTVQYDGAWDDVTTVTRGLIVHHSNSDYSDGIVIARPWRKFFTLNQLTDNSWVLGDEEREGDSVEAELARIDFNAPVEVTDKVDGSLGILYVDPDGLPALATKGSFSSDQAEYYTKLMREDEQKLQEMSTMAQGPNTYLFELVGRGNRIVLDYEKDDVILLGGVNRATGEYLSLDTASEGWSGTQAEIMRANTIGEAFAIPDRRGREGIVIRVLSADSGKQMQLKVKQDDYKKMARIMDGFSPKMIREHLVTKDASIGSLLNASRDNDITKVANLGEILAPEYENMDKKLVDEILNPKREELSNIILPRLRKLEEAREFISNLPSSEVSREGKKAFAAKVKGITDLESSDLFLLYDARTLGKSVEEISAEGFLKNISKGMKND